MSAVSDHLVDAIFWIAAGVGFFWTAIRNRQGIEGAEPGAGKQGLGLFERCTCVVLGIVAIFQGIRVLFR